MKRYLVNLCALSFAGLVLATAASEYEELEIDVEAAQLIADGVNALEQGDSTTAAALFESVLAQVPDSGAAALLGGCANWDLGDYEDGALMLQLALGNGIDFEFLDTCVNYRDIKNRLEIRRIAWDEMAPRMPLLTARVDEDREDMVDVEARLNAADRLSQPDRAIVYIACLNKIGGFDALSEFQAFLATEMFGEPAMEALSEVSACG